MYFTHLRFLAVLLLVFACASCQNSELAGFYPSDQDAAPDGDFDLGFLDGDEEDTEADGDGPEIDIIVDGDTSDGDETDGDSTDGDGTDGDITDGDGTDGDTTDGDVTDGDITDGDVTDGDVTDGDVTDGDITDGDVTDGDIACDDGNLCTDDSLENGECVSHAILCEQTGNPCLITDCNPATGECEDTFNPDGQCEQPADPCLIVACDPATLDCTGHFNPNGLCEQDDNPCTQHICEETTWSCLPTEAPGDCSDGNPCNGFEYCEAGACMAGTPVRCTDCYSCDPDTGQCFCDGSCDHESCNNIDDDCNDQIDDGGVCESDNKGLYITLSWDNWGADLDLHFLQPGGVFGSAEVDPNDCYKNNQNPDWGLPNAPGDNPDFDQDRNNGRGEDDTPEIVRLALPQNQAYRILVHYESAPFVPGFLQPTNVWVKIRLDGQLLQSYEARLESIGQLWNVACIDYPQTPTAIQNAEGDPEIATSIDGIDANACTIPGLICQNPCDCGHNLNCVAGVCSVSGNEICCYSTDCKPGKYCYSRLYGHSACPVEISFSNLPDGTPLEEGTNIEEAFLPYGVIFSTPRQDSEVVATDAWPLASDSEGLYCGTQDSNGSLWYGDIEITFVKPISAAGDEMVPAETNHVSFFVGETHVEQGLKISLFSTFGGPIYWTWVHNSKKVEFYGEEGPIHRIRIETVNDPTAVIDDLVTGPLFW